MPGISKSDHISIGSERFGPRSLRISTFIHHSMSDATLSSLPIPLQGCFHHHSDTIISTSSLTRRSQYTTRAPEDVPAATAQRISLYPKHSLRLNKSLANRCRKAQSIMSSGSGKSRGPTSPTISGDGLPQYSNQQHPPAYSESEGRSHSDSCRHHLRSKLWSYIKGTYSESAYRP